MDPAKADRLSSFLTTRFARLLRTISTKPRDRLRGSVLRLRRYRRPGNPRLQPRAWKSFPIPADVRREIDKLMATDNHHCFIAAAKDWGLILTAVTTSSWAWATLPLPLAGLVYAGAITLIGARQRGLAELLHQGAHESLARNSTLNVAAATVGSGWWVGQSLSRYYLTHVLDHHPRLGDAERDPDYRLLRNLRLYGTDRSSRNVRRYLWRIFSPAATLSYLRMIVRDRIWGSAPLPIVRLERLVRFGAWVITSIIITMLHGWSTILLYWLVPMVTTAAWVGAWAELLEHYPFMETRPKVNLYMTRNRMLGFLGRCLLGTHGEYWHLLHHLYAKMPWWNFRKAHRIMMRIPEYAELHRAHGLPAVLREMFEEADNPAALPVDQQKGSGRPAA